MSKRHQGNGRSESQTEFEAAFWMLVRRDEESNEISDDREKIAFGYATKCKPELMLLMEASDAAAAWSSVMTTNPRATGTVSFTLGEDEYLFVKENHRTVALIDQILLVQDGRKFLRAVRKLLAWAGTQSDMRPFMFGNTVTVKE